MRRGSYTDLGNGWFFALDEDWMTSQGEAPIGYVGDSRSGDPDILYGPMAWKGGIGPLSAKLLMTVGTYPWMSGEAGANEFPFPGPMEVTMAGRAAGMGRLEGRVVDSLDELVALLGIGDGDRELKVTGMEARRELARMTVPGAWEATQQ